MHNVQVVLGHLVETVRLVVPAMVPVAQPAVVVRTAIRLTAAQVHTAPVPQEEDNGRSFDLNSTSTPRAT